jgi:putative transposase
MKKRFSEEQIIVILREAQIDGAVIRDVCRKYDITEQTFFRWRQKYESKSIATARKLQELEFENSLLKKIVAEQMLVIEGMKGTSIKSNHAAAPLPRMIKEN